MAGSNDPVSERTVVKGPDGVDRLVPAGARPSDAIGYVENTPNKVDAAANYDDVDAADKAADRPTETVVRRFSNLGPEGEELEAIAERVADNREAFDEAMGTPASDADSGAFDADSATKAEIFAQAEAEGRDLGLPKSAKVDDVRAAYASAPAASEPDRED